MLDVINALRADQWLSNTPDPPEAMRTAIKRGVRDAFYQDADDWKALVYDQALTATLAALVAMAAPTTGNAR